MTAWRWTVVGITLVLALPMAARAEVVYLTGFEGPEWAAGPLGSTLPAGWWFGSGPWTIVTNPAAGGSQAVGITFSPNGPADLGSVTLGLDLGLTFDPYTNVTLSADVRLDGPQGSWAPNRPVAAAIGTWALTTDLYLGHDGRAYQGGNIVDPVAWPTDLGQWHNLAMTFDWINAEVTFSVDGVYSGSSLLATGLSPEDRTTTRFSLDSIVLDATMLIRSATYSFWFDNLTVTADAWQPEESDPAETPEPSSLILLGLGASGLVGSVWRRHILRRASSALH